METKASVKAHNSGHIITITKHFGGDDPDAYDVIDEYYIDSNDEEAIKLQIEGKFMSKSESISFRAALIDKYITNPIENEDPRSLEDAKRQIKLCTEYIDKFN